MATETLQTKNPSKEMTSHTILWEPAPQRLVKELTHLCVAGSPQSCSRLQSYSLSALTWHCQRSFGTQQASPHNQKQLTHGWQVQQNQNQHRSQGLYIPSCKQTWFYHFSFWKKKRLTWNGCQWQRFIHITAWWAWNKFKQTAVWQL